MNNFTGINKGGAIMKEWVWVIKKYTVPKEPVQHNLVGQWIYNCKNKTKN